MSDGKVEGEDRNTFRRLWFPCRAILKNGKLRPEEEFYEDLIVFQPFSARLTSNILKIAEFWCWLRIRSKVPKSSHEKVRFWTILLQEIKFKTFQTLYCLQLFRMNYFVNFVDFGNLGINGGIRRPMRSRFFLIPTGIGWKIGRWRWEGGGGRKAAFVSSHDFAFVS
jgi:hypothetical protein